MELKKNPGSDLRRWYAPIFNFGLILSVSAVLLAFEWKAFEDKPLLEFTSDNTHWEDDLIPLTIQTPPQTPPPMVAPEIKIMEDDIKIDDVITIDINLPDSEVIPEIKLDGPPIIDEPEVIMDFTEVQAQFIGGMDAWYAYLRNNLTYPKQPQRMGIEGTVFLRFVINTDGSIQDVEVVRSVDPLLDEAAVTVIQNSPKWKAALHHARPVRSRMTIPIKFKLN
ncbi:energy transducer TonB [Algoriphagus boritolerans]|uniref:Protein TonB n=2 Tax=Algoriphagus TaxID=246875 RepID=A0A1H5X7K8_9BACT|nr:energy transducer TonB [Algoriphagus boritolerans]SEG07380.1 protein TonB [Algoriphagus boritolerans DSM 17298 = JCM 18970]